VQLGRVGFAGAAGAAAAHLAGGDAAGQTGEWAAPFDPLLLGLDAEEVALFNDDRVGRALDQLFDADRASLLTRLMLGVIGEFGVDCSQLHNDSTSLTLSGAYRSADGYQRAGKPTPAAAHGHNKDHRPDLKQLLWILTVSADGAVPFSGILVHGLWLGHVSVFSSPRSKPSGSWMFDGGSDHLCGQKTALIGSEVKPMAGGRCRAYRYAAR
jgi:hypothetical protein